MSRLSQLILPEISLAISNKYWWLVVGGVVRASRHQVEDDTRCEWPHWPPLQVRHSLLVQLSRRQTQSSLPARSESIRTTRLRISVKRSDRRDSSGQYQDQGVFFSFHFYLWGLTNTKSANLTRDDAISKYTFLFLERWRSNKKLRGLIRITVFLFVISPARSSLSNKKRPSWCQEVPSSTCPPQNCTAMEEVGWSPRGRSIDLRWVEGRWVAGRLYHVTCRPCGPVRVITQLEEAGEVVQALSLWGSCQEDSLVLSGGDCISMCPGTDLMMYPDKV